jgi:hypothetical protein
MRTDARPPASLSWSGAGSESLLRFFFVAAPMTAFLGGLGWLFSGRRPGQFLHSQALAGR